METDPRANGTDIYNEPDYAQGGILIIERGQPSQTVLRVELGPVQDMDEVKIIRLEVAGSGSTNHFVMVGKVGELDLTACLVKTSVTLNMTTEQTDEGPFRVFFEPSERKFYAMALQAARGMEVQAALRVCAEDLLGATLR
ncbi:hypothetical protein JW766_06540 [Candidatus Dojkabacteria bacterium]|nr:hypothetical protein [Candidatus Dojkabacteria bacterium]